MFKPKCMLLTLNILSIRRKGPKNKQMKKYATQMLLKKKKKSWCGSTSIRQSQLEGKTLVHFQIGLFAFFLLPLKAHYIFLTQVFSQICDLQTFLPSCSLHIHSGFFFFAGMHRPKVQFIIVIF